MTTPVEICVFADAKPKQTEMIVHIEGDQSDARRYSIPDETAGAIVPYTAESGATSSNPSVSANC